MPDAPRWPLALFVVLALLYLIPIWSVAHLPTADGPSHLYNSWILHELVAGNKGLIPQYYEIDWRPHPNWIPRSRTRSDSIQMANTRFFWRCALSTRHNLSITGVGVSRWSSSGIGI